MNRREEFAVGDVPSLTVGNRSGSVEVRSGAAGQAVVTVESSDAADWDIDRLGAAITVRPKRSGWRSPSARILVEVPHGTNVDVTTASASVTMSGVLGAIRIKSASGDIRLGSVDRLDIDTASGDVRAATVASSATCDTASGDVWVERVGGRLTISTASGDVRIAEAADDVEIGSASGNVRVDRFDGDSIAVRALSGDVLVGLPSGIRVEPDVSSLSGRTRLPSPRTSPEPITDSPPRVVRVGIRTVSGDITIRRVEDG
jgi:DUF4097 and DUF4098 domain-containing protein YvlB